MSFYDDNDRAMRRAEADWLRDPREDDDCDDAAAEAHALLMQLEDAGAELVRHRADGEYRVVGRGVLLGDGGTREDAIAAGHRAAEALGWFDDAPQAEALGARRAA